MNNRKKEIGMLVDRLTDRTTSLERESVQRREFMEKVVKLFEEDLDKEEKVMVIEYLLDELSFKNIVKHPDFIHKQYSAKLIPILIGGGIALALIILTGLLFSETSWIHSINTVISSLFYKMGVG